MSTRALAPGLWLIEVPVPAISVSVTNCYLFAGADGAALVDPGWDDPGTLDALDRDWITETVFSVAEGIQGQGFEPTPSWAACSMCDYRIACPAAER